MKLKPVVAAAALALGMVGSAFAEPVVELGVVGGSPVIINAAPDGSGNDWGWLHFTLADGYTGVFGEMAGAEGLTISRLDLFGAFPIPDPWTPSASDTDLSDGFSFAGLVSGGSYKLEFIGATGASGFIQGVTAVPEPELWLGLASGLGLLGWARRRQQKQA
jgi:hypothetical protein